MYSDWKTTAFVNFYLPSRLMFWSAQVVLCAAQSDGWCQKYGMTYLDNRETNSWLNQFLVFVCLGDKCFFRKKPSKSGVDFRKFSSGNQFIRRKTDLYVDFRRFFVWDFFCVFSTQINHIWPISSVWSTVW